VKACVGEEWRDSVDSRWGERQRLEQLTEEFENSRVMCSHLTERLRKEQERQDRLVVEIKSLMWEINHSDKPIQDNPKVYAMTNYPSAFSPLSNHNLHDADHLNAPDSAIPHGFRHISTVGSSFEQHFHPPVMSRPVHLPSEHLQTNRVEADGTNYIGHGFHHVQNNGSSSSLEHQVSNHSFFLNGFPNSPSEALSPRQEGCNFGSADSGSAAIIQHKEVEETKALESPQKQLGK
jgi:hypothetical protein